MLLVAGIEAPLGWIYGACLALLPVATGAAILRYRLYDLDQIITRTLAYGLLTVLLGLGYSGLVLVGGQVFGGVAGEPPSWAVAAATLAVAAGFSRLGAGSRTWSTGASTGAATTPPGPSRPSAPACASRSTSTR